jgi:hypothetical protein
MIADVDAASAITAAESGAKNMAPNSFGSYYYL